MIKTKQLELILDGLYGRKNNESIKTIEDLTYEDILRCNLIKNRNLKIEKLKNELKIVLDNLYKAINDYKELINRTEFWEAKSVCDFNFDDWNTIKKVNGKITRYYNDIKQIERRLHIIPWQKH